jgi:hypothetical protein
MNTTGGGQGAPHRDERSWFLWLVQDWFPFVSALCIGVFYLLQFEQNRSDAAIARRVEAQKPLLQKRMDIYFEVSKIGDVLIDWDIDPKSESWKKATARFWELRWNEIELVGDAGIRQAMRRVGDQIGETEYEPSRNRHDLRWSVECLSDELRLSLEDSWGVIASSRLTATNEKVFNLPNGCLGGAQKVPPLPGFAPLKAPAKPPATFPSAAAPSPTPTSSPH